MRAMLLTSFLQIVGAVVAGNALFAAFVFYVWSAIQNEKKGKPPLELPATTLLCGLVPPLVFAGAVYLLRTQ